ncbi:MAG: hypothetical protein HC767_09255 [Akkermansiaceae bacterium]|nr:hypothetical protein [Akkermansiaceae bacterium]
MACRTSRQRHDHPRNRPSRKFQNVMEAELGKNSIVIPERLAILSDKEKVATLLPADKAVFRDWLTAKSAERNR